ncbi:hypothetical protein POM88_012040 [Heracleum sosnowskyi]|uniref:Uncharacterized protein n=1 Tax=Heracleum sosnowskyi TaxID=360622 RepID=A0AAD8IXE9_9APIA|nr:hypothetical protein POM88_012040 [Heracleum sosnowskyi]
MRHRELVNPKAPVSRRVIFLGDNLNSPAATTLSVAALIKDSDLSLDFCSLARFRVPNGCDLVAAGGLPVAYGTSHVALAHRAHLSSGQVLLVLGAAGGVGIAYFVKTDHALVPKQIEW